jgi:hypothetical protein
MVLLLKGTSLLVEAEALHHGRAWPWLASLAGLLLGGVKGRVLFSKSCARNLDRIAALPGPKPWQFFRPQFFLFLALMIAAGATLSRLAQGSYPFLIAVAILDLSIAVALLGSSTVFFNRKAFSS